MGPCGMRYGHCPAVIAQLFELFEQLREQLGEQLRRVAILSN
jgi:hypothetical protein